MLNSIESLSLNKINHEVLRRFESFHMKVAREASLT